MTRKELTWVVLTCALLVSLFLSPALFTGKALSPADMLFNYYPWLAQKPADWTTASNDLLIDSVIQFEPWLTYSAQRLHSGALPLWNPNNMLGAPFIGNMQSAVFFPLNWPFFVWPNELMLVVRAWLKLFVATLGMYILARGVARVSPLGASIASLTFTFGAFMTVWLLHPHTAAVIWLPWLWWATAQLVERPNPRWTAALASIVALSIFSGHGETAYHIALATGLFVLFYVWQTGPLQWKRVTHILGLWAAAYALGALAAAVQILPFLEYSNQSLAMIRRVERQGTPLWIPFKYAWTAISPDLFGTPTRHSWWGTVVNYNESNNYAGVLPLLLAPFAVFVRNAPQKKLAVFLLGTILLAMCVIHKAPVVFDLAYMVPGMKLAFNTRLIVVVEFALGLLAALGVDSIRLMVKQNRKVVGWVGLVALGWFVVGVALPWLLAHGYFEVPETVPTAKDGWQDGLVRAALFLTLACGLLCGLIWLARARASSARVGWAWALLPCLLVADLFQAHIGYLPTVKPADYFPDTEVTRFLQQQEGLFRIVAGSDVLKDNTNLQYGLSDIRGYDALEPPLYYQLVHFPAIKRGVGLNQPPSPLFDLLNVRYIIAPPGGDPNRDAGANSTPTDPWFVRVLDGGSAGVSVFESQRVLPRAWLTHRVEVEPDPAARPNRLADPSFDRAGMALLNAPLAPNQPLPEGQPEGGDSVTVKQYEPERVEIIAQSRAPGVLVLSDLVYPGWQAFVDDAPTALLTADHALRAVYLEAGTHTVRFEYNPESFKLGAVITGAALLLLALLAFWPRRFSKETNQTKITS